MRLMPWVSPFRGLRGIDPYGGGGFGAPRTKRAGDTITHYPHRGLDLSATVGDQVVAALAGNILHIGVAYPDSDLGSIHLISDNERGWLLKLFYGAPLATLTVGQRVNPGDVIGVAQDRTAYHDERGMTNHVHGELYERVGSEWVLRDPGQFLDLPAAA